MVEHSPKILASEEKATVRWRRVTDWCLSCTEL